MRFADHNSTFPTIPVAQKPLSDKLPDVCVSPAFGTAAGGEVWERGQQRWKRLLLKSPRGNGQAGNGRAAQDTRQKERKELGFVREKTAVLSVQTGERG